MLARYGLKSRLNFGTPEAWQRYVQTHVAPEKRAYALALGEAELWVEFYRLRGRRFPERFAGQMERMRDLEIADKTKALKALNDEIRADTMQLLKVEWRGNHGAAPIEPPRQTVEWLLNYLTGKDPTFAIWEHYKRFEQQRRAYAWEKYLVETFPNVGGPDLEFQVLVGRLGELLHQYRDRNLPLPDGTIQRIWSLPDERPGPQRTPEIETLVRLLLELLPPCSFA